jgi:DNA-directed RNA polymerase specialized sigma24 family protein
MLALEERHRNMILYRKICGLAYAELAERFGAEESTVRGWVRKSVFKLKQEIDRQRPGFLPA